MAAACFASFAILAGSLVALYGLDRSKNRKENSRKSSRNIKNITAKNHLLNNWPNRRSRHYASFLFRDS